MKIEIPELLRLREGVWGTLRFAWNLCRDTEARQRVLAMHRVFRQYHQHLAAVMLVGLKRPERRERIDVPPMAQPDGAPAGRPMGRLEWEWRQARLT